MKSVLDAPHFRTEAAAYKWVESHIWPNGPVCPFCKNDKRIGRLKGKSTRRGCYKCYACRKPFTVKVGTIFESSHIPMHIWLQGIFLMISSKRTIVSLVERGGEVRSFHVERGKKHEVAKIVSENIHRETRLMSDESPLYTRVGETFSSHETVRHRSGEYVRGDVYTNTIEGARPSASMTRPALLSCCAMSSASD